MKLKRLLNISLLAGLLLSAGACSDDNIFYPDGSWNGVVPDEWTMTLVIPDPQVVNIGGTRAYEGVLGVDRINVILYDSDNDIISNTPLQSADWTINDNNTITVTTPLDGKATRLAVVVNGPDTYTTDKTDPSEVFVSGAQEDYPVLWGESSIGNALETSTMALLRNTAMVTVKINESEVSNFDISLVGVFGTSEEGSLAPASVNSQGLPDAVTEKASGSMAYIPGSSSLASNMTAWVGEDDKTNANIKCTSLTGYYETLASYGEDNSDFPRVIIKGRYTDPSDGTSIEGYYVVALEKRAAGQDGFSETPGHFTYGNLLPMLRNHEYIINITEVRGDGWPKLEQAVQALPDNRITVEVEDRFSTITDIEATRDYYLGVGADVTANFNENATIEIVTSYPGVPASDKWYDRLDFDSDDEWIKLADENIEFISEEAGVGDAVYYTLVVDLEDNTEAEDRYGKIRVRAGKLSREILVTQLGQPYTRTRPITLTGMTKEGVDIRIDNYFSWIEGVAYTSEGTVDPRVQVTDSVQGMSRGANRNVQRRNGLHFPAVPLYDNVTYEFEAKTGETASITEGTSNFKLQQDGGKYQVTLLNADRPGIATGRLVIENFGGVSGRRVEYPLYRTGVIHYLSPTAADYQPDVESARRQGWYYYEVVKVGDTYVLDRDLGAASNKFYTKGASQYRNNTTAIGGYFKVNAARWSDYKKDTETQNRREDQQTITSRLNLVAHTPSKGRFVMATENDVLGWNVNTDGTSVSARTVAGRVADNTIYFPKIGYYEGDELKNDMHTNFWTRTYLGGTQGLGVESDEYGYWYRYYDDMKSTNPENRFSNISMARGAGVSGKSPDNNSVWRYMPLRLVWVDNDCTNPQGSAEVDNTVTGKMIVYLNTTSTPWQTVRYHYWNFANGAASNFGTRPDMEKVGENLWRAELPVPTANSGLLFSNGFDDPGNSGQTLDINSLYNEYQAGNTVLYFRTTTQISDENNNNYQKWRVELYKRSSEDNNNVTPPTPAEREGEITFLLIDDAGWGDATTVTIRINDSEGSGETLNMSKATINGKHGFKIVVNITDYPYLNDGGKVRFSNGYDSMNNLYRTTNTFNEVSSDKTKRLYVYSNTGCTDRNTYGGRYESDITNPTVVDGWTTTPVEPDYRYALKGYYNNRDWQTASDNVDAFTYNEANNIWELTVNVSSLITEGRNYVDDEGAFMIQRKTKTDGYRDWGWSNSVTDAITISSGEKMMIYYNDSAAESNRHKNFKFPSTGRYKLELEDSGTTKYLTVTKL